MDLPALAERAGGVDAAQTTYAMATIVGSVGGEQLAPYEKLYKKYFPDVKMKADNFYGTASAITVVEALKRVGPDLTREKFVDVLNQMRGFDPGVAPCKINLSPEDHQGCQSETAWKLVGNKVVTVGPTWRDVK
jgi:branched-chain amino acid transport system substrate-binding protein